MEFILSFLWKFISFAEPFTRNVSHVQDDTSGQKARRGKTHSRIANSPIVRAFFWDVGDQVQVSALSPTSQMSTLGTGILTMLGWVEYWLCWGGILPPFLTRNSILNLRNQHGNAKKCAIFHEMEFFECWSLSVFHTWICMCSMHLRLEIASK